MLVLWPKFSTTCRKEKVDLVQDILLICLIFVACGYYISRCYKYLFLLNNDMKSINTDSLIIPTD